MQIESLSESDLLGVVRECVDREMNGEAEMTSQGARKIREDGCTIAAVEDRCQCFR